MSYKKRHWRTKLDKDHITPIESPPNTNQSPGPDEYEYEEAYPGVRIPPDPNWDAILNKIVVSIALIIGMIIYKCT